MSDIAGSGTEKEINGKKYLFSPLGPADFLSFKKHLSDDALQRAFSLRSDWNMKETMEVISSTTLTDSEVWKQMNSFEGTIYLLWRSLKKKHKNISIEDVEALVTFDNMKTFGELLASLMVTPKNPPKGQENQ